MSNYNQSTFFAPKDSLTTSDPLKLIKGSEVDPEFSAISVAIGTKVDTAGAGLSIVGTTIQRTTSNVSDAAIASADTIEFNDSSAGVSNPAKTTVANFSEFLAGDGLDAAAGVLSVDVVGLPDVVSVDPANDYAIVYDATDGSLRRISIEAIANAASGTVPTSRLISTGSGLTGGGDLSADRTLSLSNSGVTAGTYGDAQNVSRVTVDAFGRVTSAITQVIQHDGLSGFVANEHINHAAVSVAAGTGLSGGGTIDASRTLSLNLASLGDVSIEDLDGTDAVAIDVDGVSRKVALQDMGTRVQASGTQTLALSDNNTIIYNAGSSTHTITCPPDTTADIPIGGTIGLVQQGTGNISVNAGGGASLTSIDGNTLVSSSGGVAVLIKIATNAWVLAGDLE